MTAVCQVSDSSTRLKESPFWEQGQRDTQDVIGRFNSATGVGATHTICGGTRSGARQGEPKTRQ